MGDFEFEGNFRSLSGLSRVLAKLGSGDFKRDLLSEMATVAVAMAQEEFMTSRDPYGSAWAPLKRPRRGGLGAGPLLATGKTKGRIRSRLFADGFFLVSPTPQSVYHQGGTRRMVARPILPDARGIPSDWLNLFDRIASNAIDRALSELR